MMYLPTYSKWHTVSRMDDKTPLFIHAGWWKRLICIHEELVEYLRIDHRSGTGSDTDYYEGKVCSSCGRILEENRLR